MARRIEVDQAKKDVGNLLAEGQLEAAAQRLRILADEIEDESVSSFALKQLAAIARRRKAVLTYEGREVEIQKQELEILGFFKTLSPTDADEPRVHVETAIAESNRAQDDPLLTCDRAFKKYAGKVQLAETSFSIRFGHILGVVGANGAGKTTLLRILARDLRPDRGEVRYSGLDLNGRFLPTQFSFVRQSPPKWHETLELHLRHQAAFQGYTDVNANKKVVTSAIELLELGEYKKRYWQELSEGFRMRAAIATAMMANPGVLILDEPLAPLDPEAQQSLLSWMKAYACSYRRLAIVVSSQHIPEIEAVADHVLLLGNAPRLLDTGGPSGPGKIRPHIDFEVSVARGENIIARLHELQGTGVLDSFHVYTTYGRLRFCGPQTVESVARLLKDQSVLYVRNVTGSARAVGFNHATTA